MKEEFTRDVVSQLELAREHPKYIGKAACVAHPMLTGRGPVPRHSCVCVVAGVSSSTEGHAEELNDMAAAYRRKFQQRHRKEEAFWPSDNLGSLMLDLERDNVAELLERWTAYANDQKSGQSVEARLKAVQDQHDAMVCRGSHARWLLPAGCALVCVCVVVTRLVTWPALCAAGRGACHVVRATGGESAAPQHPERLAALRVCCAWLGDESV